MAEDRDSVTDEFSNHINMQPLPENSPEVLAYHCVTIGVNLGLSKDSQVYPTLRHQRIMSYLLMYNIHTQLTCDTQAYKVYKSQNSVNKIKKKTLTKSHRLHNL